MKTYYSFSFSKLSQGLSHHMSLIIVTLGCYLLVLVCFLLISLNQMVNSLSMIRHVFESSSVASEPIHSVSVSLKYEFIIMRHGVKTSLDIHNLFDFTRHYFTHNLKLKMRVNVITFISHFVCSEVFTI